MQAAGLDDEDPGAAVEGAEGVRQRAGLVDENGLLVPDADVASLAGAIGSLLVDEGLRARLGSAARRTVSESHDLRDAARKHLRLYENMLEAVPV